MLAPSTKSLDFNSETIQLSMILRTDAVADQAMGFHNFVRLILKILSKVCFTHLGPVGEAYGHHNHITHALPTLSIALQPARRSLCGVPGVPGSLGVAATATAAYNLAAFQDGLLIAARQSA